MFQRVVRVAPALLVLCLILAETGIGPQKLCTDRVYRVGVDHTPPFYEIQADGSVRGLAVEVLNEAARRRGIHLKWVTVTDDGLDDALTRRVVDLWPLVAPLKSRQDRFFLSKPWLESDYVFVSRSSKPIRNKFDAEGQVIAHANLKLTKMFVERHLSRSTPLMRQTRDAAVRSVCLGESAAAVVESQVVDAMLLNRPAGCEKVFLKISNIAEAHSPLCIMAVPEAGPAARDLREGISDMASDGTLSKMLDEWSPFSAEGTRSVWARESADLRSQICLTLAGLVLLLALGLGAVARRAFQLKKAAQGSEERYRLLAQQQQKTMAELQASENRWQLALNGAGNGLWDWDLSNGKIYRSSGWKTMLGYAEHEIGTTLDDWRKLLHPDDEERAVGALQSHLRREASYFSCDYRLKSRDGGWRWVSDRGQAVWDEFGRAIRVAGSQTDITARMAEQQALSLEARTDALTGLWNRREFNRALEIERKASNECGHPVSLCLFDLDDFKSINDRFGHSAGDQVLISFGRLLRDTLRRSDICCRLGGDEFVAILPKTEMDDAIHLGERVCAEFRETRFEARSGEEFRAKCSFGVGQAAVEDPLQQADAKLYQAKQRTSRMAFIEHPAQARKFDNSATTALA